MRQLTIMRQALADTIEADGEDELLEMICSRVAEGENPRDIARSMGFNWHVLKEWLKENGRMEKVEFAIGCFADGLIWEGLEAVRCADVENVSVARLQADHFTKIAEKMDRERWGNKQQVEVTGSGDIKRLLELRAARIAELSPPVEVKPVPIEGQFEMVDGGVL